MWNKTTTKWPVYKLAELLVDFTKKNKADEDIPVYSVTNEKGFTISTEYFSKEVFSKNLTTYKIVERNDFAYNPSRINVGSIDFFQHEGRGLISPLYVTFKVKSELEAKFLKYYLKSSFGNAQIRNNTSGSVRDSLSFKHLSNVTIPLPPLEDQKRIVRDLDIAEQMRQKRKQAIVLLDAYLKSVFLEMFGSPSHNSHDFSIGTIGDLVSEVKYGTSKKAEEDGEYPYLRMNNITYNGEIDISDLKYINLTEAEEPKYLVQKGDILFNRTNSKELVGKTAVYDLDEPMAIAGYLIRVRTNEYAIPEYISGYLNSMHGKTTLENMCKSIVGMANINAQELQKIKLTIPPVALQKEYASVVEKTKQIKRSMLVQSEELNVNFDALMQDAFAAK